MIRLIVLAGLVLSLLVTGSLPAYATSLSPIPIIAQVETFEVNSQDIAHFTEAYQAIQTIKQTAEGDMVKAVEAAGLTVDQFNEMAGQQLEGTGESTPATDQTNQFAMAVGDIIAIRQTAETDMEAAIQAVNLPVEKFNQILEQAAQDTDLQAKIKAQLQP